ncbi:MULTISPECIES: NADH-quinone oxidoreductase subunit NuoN [Deefgea]|uniref:NADH-quinone oxidoreductase subunit N n=1 Tax=Deefgea chitinilytica TaxID=570276 RepID=A0ABS2CAV9_9NEIS|nr:MULTISPECIES: NADH-quinone oxidoreductase subunit NuoN [Deefgea]MBM5571162.1 NADH-quinone oxidoreductase subunit NuoN [Deefgea chitinilytica]MBM9888394.1 NADH-quinone oxidoreductase subunit NuoN [Deefgea sp. CFH1-16]
MTWTSLNAWVAAPEIFLLCATCAILLLDLFISDAKRYITYVLTLLTLAATAALVLNGYEAHSRLAFSGLFLADPIASYAKLAMIVGVALVLIYGRSYATERGLFRGELFTLSLFSLLGMMVMASASNFLALYVGLELMSLSVYALVALNRESTQSTEAAMKYFILGALASGMLLYGISMLYGATGSLDIFEVSKTIKSGEANTLLAVFGIVFVVTGLGFKFGAVPFHMWVPDVYQGAPTPITQLISSAPKAAVFVFTLRILAQALDGFAPDWRGMLMVLAVLSMGLGNITAISQTNIKRMLGYSTISHMGFVLLGILVAQPVGYSAALFYVFAYILMSAAAFGVLMLLSRKGFEADQIADLKGLNQRSPWFAAMMLLTMFSMAGIPIFVGFFAKLAVLKAVVYIGYVGLAIIAVVFSLIGAFYYLRVVKVMYFDEPTDKSPIEAGSDAKLVLSVNCLLLLVLGFMPDRLMNLLSDAVSQSFNTLPF